MKLLPRYVIKYPYAVLMAIIGITIVFASHLGQLHLRTSIYDLSIENLPETRFYEDFKKEFGTEEIILVVVRARNVFDPSTFKYLEKLSQALSEVKGVKRVISLPSIKKQISLAQNISLDKFRLLVRPVRLFKGNLLAPDATATAITLILKNDADKDAIISSVQRLLEKNSKGLTVYQTGMPLVSKALAEYTRMDFMHLPPIALMVMCLILWILFRRASGVLIPALSVLIGLSWTFGLMAWLGRPLSMVTMIVPVFIIAVGTAYCMYVLAEYYRLIEINPSRAEAIYKCFGSVSLPTALAVATTVIGVGSLVLNKIESIRDFALFSCFGILSMFIIIMTFVPSLLLVLPHRKRDKQKTSTKANDFLTRFIEKIITLNLRHQKKVFIIIAILSAFSLAGIARIKVETNPVEYFKKDTPVSRHFRDIYRDMAGCFPLSVVLDSKVEDYFENPSHVMLLDEIEKLLLHLDGVDKAISFADYLELVNYSSNQYQSQYYEIPQEGFELRMLINRYRIILGYDMLKRFVSDDFSKATILLRTHISSSRKFLETKKAIVALVKEKFPKAFDVHVTGLGIVISQSSHLLTVGQIKSISLTLVLIFGIMLLLFLSAKAAMVALVPNIFPIVVNFGLMGWLGIDLSLATSLVACVAIGLAVDDTIHYLVRYNTEFRKDLNKDRALTETLRIVGRPIVFTTITISAGFSILSISHFKPTSVFGLMMVAIMVSALAGDLLLLPSLMLHVELLTAWDLLKMMPPGVGLSPSLVHELNQPLNAIKMGSEFLKMTASQEKGISNQQLLKVAEQMSLQVDRASEIINTLMAFEKSVDFRKKGSDVNDTVKDVVRVVDHQLHLESIVLELDLGADLPPVALRKDRLGQLIFNMINNAREAIEERDKVCPDKKPRRIVVRSFISNKGVAIEIIDTGVGIPESNRKRIFEPFFTTRQPSEGRGLGLSIVQQIVRDCGGRIYFETERCKGTKFTVVLPSNETALI